MPADLSETESRGLTGQRSNVAEAYPANSSNMMRRILMILPFIALVGYISRRDIRRKMKKEEATKSKVIDTESDIASRNVNASRIAACYSGHVGTFEKVYEQNVKALQSLSATPVSYFFVLDLNDDYRDARSGVHYTQMHEIGTLQPIFDKLSARSVETFSSLQTMKSRAESSCVGDHAPVQDDAGHYSEAYAMLYAAARCFQFVQEDEKRRGQRYDWIVRLRPDMEIAIKLPPEDATTRVHMSGTALALVPREQAEDYFSVVNAFDENNCNEIQDMSDDSCKNYAYEGDSPECLIIKWLTRKDIVPSNGLYVNRRIVYPE